MNGLSIWQENDVSVKIHEKNSIMVKVWLENSSQKDKVFLLFLTNIDDFKVHPASGRIKGKKEKKLFHLNSNNLFEIEKLV